MQVWPNRLNIAKILREILGLPLSAAHRSACTLSVCQQYLEPEDDLEDWDAPVPAHALHPGMQYQQELLHAVQLDAPAADELLDDIPRGTVGLMADRALQHEIAAWRADMRAKPAPQPASGPLARGQSPPAPARAPPPRTARTDAVIQAARARVGHPAPAAPVPRDGMLAMPASSSNAAAALELGHIDLRAAAGALAEEAESKADTLLTSRTQAPVRHAQLAQGPAGSRDPLSRISELDQVSQLLQLNFGAAPAARTAADRMLLPSVQAACDVALAAANARETPGFQPPVPARQPPQPAGSAPQRDAQISNAEARVLVERLQHMLCWDHEAEDAASASGSSSFIRSGRELPSSAGGQLLSSLLQSSGEPQLSAVRARHATAAHVGRAVGQRHTAGDQAHTVQPPHGDAWDHVYPSGASSSQQHTLAAGQARATALRPDVSHGQAEAARQRRTPDQQAGAAAAASEMQALLAALQLAVSQPGAASSAAKAEPVASPAAARTAYARPSATPASPASPTKHTAGAVPPPPPLVDADGQPSTHGTLMKLITAVVRAASERHNLPATARGRLAQAVAKFASVHDPDVAVRTLRVLLARFSGQQQAPPQLLDSEPDDADRPSTPPLAAINPALCTPELPRGRTASQIYLPGSPQLARPRTPPGPCPHPDSRVVWGSPSSPGRDAASQAILAAEIPATPVSSTPATVPATAAAGLVPEWMDHQHLLAAAVGESPDDAAALAKALCHQVHPAQPYASVREILSELRQLGEASQEQAEQPDASPSFDYRSRATTTAMSRAAWKARRAAEMVQAKQTQRADVPSATLPAELAGAQRGTDLEHSLSDWVRGLQKQHGAGQRSQVAGWRGQQLAHQQRHAVTPGQTAAQKPEPQPVPALYFPVQQSSPDGYSPSARPLPSASSHQPAKFSARADMQKLSRARGATASRGPRTRRRSAMFDAVAADMAAKDLARASQA